MGNALHEMRHNSELPVSGFDQAQAAQTGIKPISDGTISIVVQTVHIRRIKTAVRQYGIPAFPDGGGAHLHFIQPARRIFLQKQFSGRLVFSVVTQRQTEVRCPDKTGGQMVLVRQDVLLQTVGNFRHEFLFNQTEMECQRHGGLRF